jgi:yeast amino acid transporter
MQPSPNAVPDAEVFFGGYLAAPIVIALYLFWRVWSRDTKLFIRAHEMDLKSGLHMLEDHEIDDNEMTPKTWASLPMRIVRGLF